MQQQMIGQTHDHDFLYDDNVPKRTLPIVRMSSQVGLEMSSHHALSEPLPDASRDIRGGIGATGAGTTSERCLPFRPLLRMRASSKTGY